MTIRNKTSLKTFFEQGDVPTGTNYADFIDSCVNMAETAVQTMSGPLNPTEIITPRVSAGTGVFTGNVTINGSLNTSNILASAASVYVSAVRAFNGVFVGVGIVSATGTAQATASTLVNVINIGAGITDGQDTGFILQSNKTGLVQYIINGGASANLYPCTGGQINVLSSNAAFGMAANTLYTVVHTNASAYAVK